MSWLLSAATNLISGSEDQKTTTTSTNNNTNIPSPLSTAGNSAASISANTVTTSASSTTTSVNNSSFGHKQRKELRIIDWTMSSSNSTNTVFFPLDWSPFLQQKVAESFAATGKEINCYVLENYTVEHVRNLVRLMTVEHYHHQDDNHVLYSTAASMATTDDGSSSQQISSNANIHAATPQNQSSPSLLNQSPLHSSPSISTPTTMSSASLQQQQTGTGGGGLQQQNVNYEEPQLSINSFTSTTTTGQQLRQPSSTYIDHQQQHEQTILAATNNLSLADAELFPLLVTKLRDEFEESKCTNFSDIRQIERAKYESILLLETAGVAFLFRCEVFLAAFSKVMREKIEYAIRSNNENFSSINNNQNQNNSNNPNSASNSPTPKNQTNSLYYGGNNNSVTSPIRGNASMNDLHQIHLQTSQNNNNAHSAVSHQHHHHHHHNNPRCFYEMLLLPVRVNHKHLRSAAEKTRRSLHIAIFGVPPKDEKVFTSETWDKTYKYLFPIIEAGSQSQAVGASGVATEHSNLPLARPRWESDDTRDFCISCQKPYCNSAFSLMPGTVYRSHCRACGKLLCKNCVGGSVQTNNATTNTSSSSSSSSTTTSNNKKNMMVPRGDCSFLRDNEPMQKVCVDCYGRLGEGSKIRFYQDLVERMGFSVAETHILALIDYEWKEASTAVLRQYRESIYIGIPNPRHDRMVLDSAQHAFRHPQLLLRLARLPEIWDMDAPTYDPFRAEAVQTAICDILKGTETVPMRITHPQNACTRVCNFTLDDPGTFAIQILSALNKVLSEPFFNSKKYQHQQQQYSSSSAVRTATTMKPTAATVAAASAAAQAVEERQDREQQLLQMQQQQKQQQNLDDNGIPDTQQQQQQQQPNQPQTHQTQSQSSGGSVLNNPVIEIRKACHECLVGLRASEDCYSPVELEKMTASGGGGRSRSFSSMPNANNPSSSTFLATSTSSVKLPFSPNDNDNNTNETSAPDEKTTSSSSSRKKKNKMSSDNNYLDDEDEGPRFFTSDPSRVSVWLNALSDLLLDSRIDGGTRCKAPHTPWSSYETIKSIIRISVRDAQNRNPVLLLRTFCDVVCREAFVSGGGKASDFKDLVKREYSAYEELNALESFLVAMREIADKKPQTEEAAQKLLLEKILQLNGDDFDMKTINNFLCVDDGSSSGGGGSNINISNSNYAQNINNNINENENVSSSSPTNNTTTSSSSSSSTTKSNSEDTEIHDHMFLKLTKSVPYPFDDLKSDNPMLIEGIDIKNTKVFGSQSKPVLIPLILKPRASEYSTPDSYNNNNNINNIPLSKQRKIKKILLKSEDLWNDHLARQFALVLYDLMEKWLNKQYSRHSQKKKGARMDRLKLFMNGVLPLSPKNNATNYPGSGIVEMLPDTAIPLRKFVQGKVARSVNEVKIVKNQNTPQESVEIKKVASLKNYLVNTARDPHDSGRGAFCRSVQFSILLCHILGVADRHQDNILVDKDALVAVDIDFGHLFGEETATELADRFFDARTSLTGKFDQVRYGLLGTPATATNKNSSPTTRTGNVSTPITSSSGSGSGGSTAAAAAATSTSNMSIAGQEMRTTALFDEIMKESVTAMMDIENHRNSSEKALEFFIDETARMLFEGVRPFGVEMLSLLMSRNFSSTLTSSSSVSGRGIGRSSGGSSSAISAAAELATQTEIQRHFFNCFALTKDTDDAIESFKKELKETRSRTIQNIMHDVGQDGLAGAVKAVQNVASSGISAVTSWFSGSK